jgi:hypothetical protein
LLKVVPVYERDITMEELRDGIMPFIYNNYRKEKIDFGNGKLE